MSRIEFHDHPADFQDSGAHVARIPPGIRTKRGLLAVLEQTLRLPDYFGRNWDALEECLRDLTWLEAQRVVLVHESLPLTRGRRNQRVYVRMLQDLVQQEHPGQREIVVIFPTSSRRRVEELTRETSP